MDIQERNQLVEAINLLRTLIESGHHEELVKELEDVTLETNEEWKDDYIQETAMTGVQKKYEPSMNGKAGKEEKRVEKDDLVEPPLSESVLSDVAECVIDLSSDEMQRGKSMECVVIGSYTGQIASAISDSFSGPGGRILCIGDCLDGEGINQDWAGHVGGNLGKTVYPVKGDVNENYQGLERLLDFVVLSTCGTYQDMASMVSRWAGLLRTGGAICGTQFNREHYQASVSAIEDIFGADRMEKSDSGFWCVRVGV